MPARPCRIHFATTSDREPTITDLNSDPGRTEIWILNAIRDEDSVVLVSADDPLGEQKRDAALAAIRAIEEAHA